MVKARTHNQHTHTLHTEPHAHVDGGNASVVVITSCTHKFVLEMPQPIQVKRYHISVTQVPLYTSCVEHRETSEFLRHANIESVSPLTLGTKKQRATGALKSGGGDSYRQQCNWLISMLSST